VFLLEQYAVSKVATMFEVQSFGLDTDPQSLEQLSAEVQYIIPTNHAYRIVTHARYINRACSR